MLEHVTQDELVTAGAELTRAADSARVALRNALADGRDTGEHRARLARIEYDVHHLVARLAHLREEAEADRSRAIADAGRTIAMAVATRLKQTLARLTPPRAPAVMRGQK